MAYHSKTNSNFISLHYLFFLDHKCSSLKLHNDNLNIFFWARLFFEKDDIEGRVVSHHILAKKGGKREKTRTTYRNFSINVCFKSKAVTLNSACPLMLSLTLLCSECFHSHHPIFFAWHTYWMGRSEKVNRPFFDHDTTHGFGIVRQALEVPFEAVRSSVKNHSIVLVRPLCFLDPPFAVLFIIAFRQRVKLIVLIFFTAKLAHTCLSWAKHRTFFSFRQCSRTTLCYSYQMCWRCSWRMDRSSHLRSIAVPLFGYVQPTAEHRGKGNRNYHMITAMT